MILKHFEMMRLNNKIWIVLILAGLFAVSCDGLLDVDSERYVYPEDNEIATPGDAIYSMNGLFAELNKIADRYVILGELRADLMDVTENASAALKEISQLSVSEGNPYVDSKDYYTIINNCNYIIEMIDTAFVQRAEKVLYRDFAEVKAIRAWTYMQIALNFGKATYYENPLLTIVDANKDYPVYGIAELADVLIQDLEPWRDIELPMSLSLGRDVNSGQLYFPIRFVLGDLYLWKGDYEKAAQAYYDLIYDGEYVIDESYQSSWMVENNAFTNSIMVNWSSIFQFNERELITLIAGSNEGGRVSLMDSLVNDNYEVLPSTVAVENWDSQVYYHNATVQKEGDLRGNYGSYRDPARMITSLGYVTNESSNPMITKYNEISTEYTKAVVIYRTGLLYLRYAEAVNRTGKPNIAFATIKHGLNKKTFRVDTIVPDSEKYMGFDENGDGIYNEYTSFDDIRFDNNIGIHARGTGKVNLSTEFVIPKLNSTEDSIKYVEDLIVKELALETAFEGNRFQDLMRISLRRNDPSYLAKIVATKHVDNAATIEAKLKDMNNWYLPVFE